MSALRQAILEKREKLRTPSHFGQRYKTRYTFPLKWAHPATHGRAIGEETKAEGRAARHVRILKWTTLR